MAGLGGDAVLTCISSPLADSVEWLINGTFLDVLQLSGVTEQHITIRFSNVPAEYNKTRIQCRADTVPSSETATLLVQGLLQC